MDAVTKPSHYTQWPIEPRVFILGNDMPFWMGNVIKYIMRADAKNGLEDLRKAQQYIQMRIEQLNGETKHDLHLGSTKTGQNDV